MNRPIFSAKNLSWHLVVVCLANSPFWIIGGMVFINRPLINYDTIVALIIAVFLKPLGAIFLILAWIVDGIVSQSFTYQFLTPIDFLYSSRFGADLDWLQFLCLWHVAGLSIFFIALYFCLKFTCKASQTPSTSLFNLFLVGSLLTVLDAANGASDIWRRDRMVVPINIAGSPQYTLFNGYLKPKEERSLRKITDNQSIIKKFDIVGWATKHPDRSILFVVVESLGIPKSTDSLVWIKNKIEVDDYQTSFYEVEFKGATTNGELRSLCGLEGSYTAASAEVATDCLPAQLSRMGWSTSGYHGFSKKMFDRQSWWPNMGLNQTFFIESSEIGALPLCGNVFRGACDKDLLKLAAKQIVTPKSFVYALTLNTHLPVVPIGIPATLSQICAKDKLSDGVCMHIASTGNILGQIAASTNHLPKSPLIVVVGDHAPPFSTLTDRNSFKQNVVPGFILVPRN